MFSAPKRPAFWRAPRRERNAPTALAGTRYDCTSAASTVINLGVSNIFGPFRSDGFGNSGISRRAGKVYFDIPAQSAVMLFPTFAEHLRAAGRSRQAVGRG